MKIKTLATIFALGLCACLSTACTDEGGIAPNRDSQPEQATEGGVEAEGAEDRDF